MKQKLEGHQMTPPAGLWEGISSEMNLEPKSAPKSAMIRRLYWAAAAAIVAIVGFFAFYQFDESQPQLVAKHEQPSSEMAEETYLPKTIKIKQQETPKKPKTPEVSTVPEVTEISEVAELAEVAEVTEVTEVAKTPEEPKTPEPSDAPVLASTERSRPICQMSLNQM